MAPAADSLVLVTSESAIYRLAVPQSRVVMADSLPRDISPGQLADRLLQGQLIAHGIDRSDVTNPVLQVFCFADLLTGYLQACPGGDLINLLQQMVVARKRYDYGELASLGACLAAQLEHLTSKGADQWLTDQHLHDDLLAVEGGEPC